MSLYLLEKRELIITYSPIPMLCLFILKTATGSRCYLYVHFIDMKTENGNLDSLPSLVRSKEAEARSVRFWRPHTRTPFYSTFCESTREFFKFTGK